MQIRKEKEALLLKEQINDDDIVQRFEEFEDDVFVAERAGKVRIKSMIQITEEDPSEKDTKFTTQKVKEWLANVNLKELDDSKQYFGLCCSRRKRNNS